MLLSGYRTIRDRLPPTFFIPSPVTMPVPCAAESADPLQFLRVAAQGASLATHEDLWRWLRGEVQALLPHELFLAAWGDFRAGTVHIDLVSSLPGLRTREVRSATFLPLAHYLRDCWVAAQHAPCQVDVHGCDSLRTALVHGTRDAEPPRERVFAALTWRARSDDAQAQALKLLVPFIDTALRRMATLPALALPPADTLSERERQIMAWVAMGKTNPEIGCILRISEFTVKNHMKSIFSKLDVSNRAQAVARLTRLPTLA